MSTSTHKPIRYYHGGNRGLNIGDYILPPSITKALSTSDVGDPRSLHRKNRVYVTVDVMGAKLFASGAPHPVVYEVEPEGNLEDDPDHKEPGHSFMCEKAKIVAIHKIPGKEIKQARRVLNRRSMHQVRKI